MAANPHEIAMSTVNYTEIGLLLKAAREEAGLSLRQASDALHIRAHYLDALERGDLGELPGMAYTKGYLQAYVTYLNLDQKEVLRRYEQVENALPRRGFYLPEVFSKEKTPNNGMIWGGIVAAAVFYMLWRLIFSPSSVAVDVVEKPPQRQYREYRVKTVLSGACFRGDVVLYPPCYGARVASDKAFGLYPPRIQARSVMDFTVMGLTTHK